MNVRHLDNRTYEWLEAFTRPQVDAPRELKELAALRLRALDEEIDSGDFVEHMDGGAAAEACQRARRELTMVEFVKRGDEWAREAATADAGRGK